VRWLYRYLAPVDAQLGVTVDRRPPRPPEALAGTALWARRTAARLRHGLRP
jgi:hypothetical protein